MTTIRCKNCGGDVRLSEDGRFAVCEYCGSILNLGGGGDASPEARAVSGEILLKRGALFLEDEEWERAYEYFDRALDLDPCCAAAYEGRLFARFGARNFEELPQVKGFPNLAAEIEEDGDYQKMRRFGGRAYEEKYDPVLAMLAEAYRKTCYDGALRLFHNAVAPETLRRAAGAFRRLETYRDAAVLAAECEQRACNLEEKAAQAAKSARRRANTIFALLLVTGLAAALLWFYGIPALRYQSGVQKMESGDYDAAIRAFEEAGRFKNSEEQKKACAYREAQRLEQEKKPEQAIFYYALSGDHADGAEKLRAYWKDRVVPQTLAVSSTYIVGIRPDGTAAAAGQNSYGQFPRTDTAEAFSVSAALWHSVVLHEDGSVEAFGKNRHGQCAVSGWRQMVQVAAGETVTAGLHCGGTLYLAVDEEEREIYADAEKWTGVVSVAAGSRHIAARMSDGTVRAAGDNADGQCMVESWRDITMLAAGRGHTVGLRSDGTVLAAGDNACGQCETQSWHGVVQIAAGENHTVGLLRDGTVVAAGRADADACAVDAWTDMAFLAAGGGSTAAVRHSDGGVEIAGDGRYPVKKWEIRHPDK